MTCWWSRSLGSSFLHVNLSMDFTYFVCFNVCTGACAFLSNRTVVIVGISYCEEESFFGKRNKLYLSFADTHLISHWDFTGGFPKNICSLIFLEDSFQSAWDGDCFFIKWCVWNGIQNKKYSQGVSRRLLKLPCFGVDNLGVTKLDRWFFSLI